MRRVFTALAALAMLLFLLGRFNRPHGLSSQDFFARMRLEATEGA